MTQMRRIRASGDQLEEYQDIRVSGLKPADLAAGNLATDNLIC
jgi:hypothetical protein